MNRINRGLRDVLRFILELAVMGIVGIGALLVGIAAISLAGVISFGAFNDPLDIMGPYGDGVGNAGWNGWLGIWAYGLMIWAAIGFFYLASRWLYSREDLAKECDRLEDEIRSLRTENGEVLRAFNELRVRISRVEELEEICSDLKSESVSSREHILFLKEANTSLHKLNDELFSELDELGEQLRSKEMESLAEDGCRGEKDELLVEPETQSVRLIDVGLKKVSVIKAIPEVTDAGLKDAKELVEAAPVIVATDLSPVMAKGLVASIEESGARAEVCSREHPLSSD